MSMAHMSRPPETAVPTERDAAGRTIYHCGPLTYTFRGLVILFAWLLWGDFCFMLMETVAPSVLPVKFKLLDASDTTISIILTTLPGIMNMTVCPWVSSASDRYRGKWGRRIPFIISTMPFLTVSLVLLGWSDQLTVGVQHMMPSLQKASPATITILLIGLFYTTFAFFNMFVGSVFWYLFNDVVPPQFLGRFMGLFRIVSSAVTRPVQLLCLQARRDPHARDPHRGRAGVLHRVRPDVFASQGGRAIHPRRTTPARWGFSRRSASS